MEGLKFWIAVLHRIVSIELNFPDELSSRSHRMIRLTIEISSCELLARDNTLTASVNFVDLTRSERPSQSLSDGTWLKEGCHINCSLLTILSCFLNSSLFH